MAIFTFLVWALPAIVIMGLIGVFFSQVDGSEGWKPIITYLPAVAVSFILFAAITLSKKVLKDGRDWFLFAVMLSLGILFAGISMWVVPILLMLGGSFTLLPHRNEKHEGKIDRKPRWILLFLLVSLALLNEVLRIELSIPLVTLYTSFYRYGYSVIGGGQIVIPLMIQDLVQSQSLLSLRDFLAGYAIDQAIPGPLFSFAAFVSARSFTGTGFSFLAGLIGGLSIFLPGILLVFFMFPLWKSMRHIPQIKHFLHGVTVTAAGLIAMTAITQTIKLPVDGMVYGIVVVGTGLLLTKKIPAPLIVVIAAAMGFV